MEPTENWAYLLDDDEEERNVRRMRKSRSEGALSSLSSSFLLKEPKHEHSISSISHMSTIDVQQYEYTTVNYDELTPHTQVLLDIQLGEDEAIETEEGTGEGEEETETAC